MGILSGKAPTGAVVFGTAQGPIETPESLTVVTWNMHYGAGPTLHRGAVTPKHEVVEHLDGIAASLVEWGADVVALQEVDRDGRRCFGIDQLGWIRHRAGFPFAAWVPTWNARYVPHPAGDPRLHIGRVWSGQAILSRFPLFTPRRHALPQPKAQGRLYNRFYLHRALQEVWLDLGGGQTVRILNAHLEAFDVANKELHAHLTAEIVTQVKDPTVLMGDLNTVPPEATHRHDFPDEPETDMRNDRTLAILREVPGFVEAPPKGEGFTFPAHAPNRRLDHLFVSEGITATECEVMKSQHSDHLPVRAVLHSPTSA